VRSSAPKAGWAIAISTCARSYPERSSRMGARSSSSEGAFAITTAGRRMVKVDLSPGALRTAMSPPISRQNSRLSASPTLVPPYLACVSASA
jgi:hypothetical protein